jgi:putative ABC transport system substrate-binding protein
MHHVKRRDFIALLGSAATVWPLAVPAQQPVANMPVVTLVNARTADAAIAFVAEFRKGLSQTGLTEGRDLAVEYHWMDGHYEELPAIISDAIRRHVAVIATPASTPGSLAAKAATSAIPIVFGVGEDPVALGLVASLAQPGANATGINFFASEIDSKRLGLMHELLPKARRLAVLVNHANPITAEATTRALNDAAPGLGLQLIFFNASTAAEIDAAFAAFADARAEALFIAPDGFFASRHLQMATLATRGRIPASDFTKDSVGDGLLMSYGTSIADVFRQVGVYVGSILKGAKPADLPVLQATKFEFTINLPAHGRLASMSRHLSWRVPTRLSNSSILLRCTLSPTGHFSDMTRCPR